MFVPKQGLVVAGRYSLLREVGRGGMGSVWEARDLELDAPCALKFILEHIAHNPDLRRRFLREARAVAQLPSPHVVSVRGVGEHEGALYTAMELLRGETLEDRLERERVLDPLTVFEILQQVASVLTLAHGAGIAHRDLKPENIWLWEGGNVFVKVIDFGVAKNVLSTSMVQTSTGALIGTPRYMSPEQAAGVKQVDHRSDVWSLAVIAVQCLSGVCPFDSEGLGELLLKIMHSPIPPLRRLYPDASDELAAWWEQASQRDPNERFQTAAALTESFGSALRANLRSSAMLGLASPPDRARPTQGNALRSPPASSLSPDTGSTQESMPPTELAPTERAGGLLDTPRPARAQEPQSVRALVPDKLPMTRIGWLPVAALVGLVGVAALWQLGVLKVGAEHHVTPSAANVSGADAVLDPPKSTANGSEAPSPSSVPSVVPVPVSPEPASTASILPRVSPGPSTRPAVERAPLPARKDEPATISAALTAEAQKTQEALKRPPSVSLRPATPRPATPKKASAAVKSQPAPARPPRAPVDDRVGF